jgi:arylsulfatase A-like enzyme
MPYPRAKCSLYEAGLATALFMRWPRGGWTAGRVAPELISNVDILPTLLELAGAPCPANVQGQSFLQLLAGGAGGRAELFGEMTYHDYCDPRRSLRTARHKLIANFTTAPGFMDPSQQWRPKTLTVHPREPAFDYHPPVELYDLAKDPLERRNLAAAPEHAAVRAHLLRRLHEWMRETEDPLLNGIPTPPMHLWAMNALRTGEVSAQPPMPPPPAH